MVRSTTTTVPVASAVTWAKPTPVSSSPLLAVSCATPTFCVAVDSGGNAYRFNGTQWSPPTTLAGRSGLGGDVTGVSCTSANFCVAIPPGSDSVTSWNGTSWSGPVPVSVNDLQGISCVGASFCATVDGVGDAYLYDGSGWSGSSNDWGGISAISCVNSSFCVSVAGGISVFNGSSWTEPDPEGATSNFVGVSCPVTSFCMAVDALGQALDFTGTWSEPVTIEPAATSGTGPTPTAVSCWAPGNCLAVDSAGQAITMIGTPSVPTSIDPGHSLNAVSCSATLCVAVDAQGDAVVGRR